MGIDNLKKVYWIYESYVTELRVNPENRIQEINKQLRGREQFNICHRAEQEIQGLVLNDKESIIKEYYIKFSHIEKELNEWKKKLKKRFNMNYVYSGSSHFRGVIKLINFYFYECYPEEFNKDNDITQNKEGNKTKKYHISQKQKKVIDFLINEGYRESHVYRFLTSPEATKKGFNMITERVFAMYLNKYHGREYKKGYRFSRNIQIPDKMFEDFEVIWT